jgi:hypothetical protein
MHLLQSYQENSKTCKMDVLNLRSLKETRIQSILESANGHYCGGNFCRSSAAHYPVGFKGIFATHFSFGFEETTGWKEEK